MDNFENNKVYIDEKRDNWNQYITMESTQEVTPTSSIGDSSNNQNIRGSEVENFNVKNEGGINVVTDTETESPIEDIENMKNINEVNPTITKNNDESVKDDDVKSSRSCRLEEKNSSKKSAGSRVRRAEHQSGVPGVYWQESSQRWIAQWSDSISGRRITHGFSARVYGFEDAKQMAIKSRIEAIEKGKATARKLHETMDMNSKFFANNKKNKLSSKEKNASFNGLVNNHNNIRNIMNNISDEGMCVLLEEMRHLKEDFEYEGIFWHPINKVWIGVWLDSMTHETFTQSFPHEISEDGIDISRLKAIEWRLKLLNEKKLRDNVVEYVNNKEFKYNVNNSMLSNNRNCFENNYFSNFIPNTNVPLHLQNYYNSMMNQVMQLYGYGNHQNNIGSINNNIENIIYATSLLYDNSSVSSNQLHQINNLITNYLNNINNMKNNNGNTDSEIVINGKNNMSDINAKKSNNEDENGNNLICKQNCENNQSNCEKGAENFKNVIGGKNIESNYDNYYDNINLPQQIFGNVNLNGNYTNLFNINMNNLLLSLSSIGKASSMINNNNLNNIVLPQTLNNCYNFGALNQIELFEPYNNPLFNYGFFCNNNSNNFGVNNIYNFEMNNDILKNFIGNQIIDFNTKKEQHLGNNSALNKFSMLGINSPSSNINQGHNILNGTINGFISPFGSNNATFRNTNNDIGNNIDLNDLNASNVDILSKYDLLNSVNIRDIVENEDNTNVRADLSVDQNDEKNHISDCQNLSRSETSSSSVSSNSTDLSLIKKIESNIIIDMSESSSTVPTIASTPMSVTTPSSTKIKATPKKKLSTTNYKSGIPGVYWKTRDQEWVAEWYDQSRKRHSRHFYVKKYGFNEAKKLAIQCRLNAVNSGEAVLRSNYNNNLNLTLGNDEDFAENINTNSPSPDINNSNNSIEDINVQ